MKPEGIPSPPEVRGIDQGIQDLEESHGELLLRWRWAIAGICSAVVVAGCCISLAVVFAGEFAPPLIFFACVGVAVAVSVCLGYALENRMERIGIRRELHRQKLTRSEILAGRVKRSVGPYARYKEHLPSLAEHYKIRAQRYRRMFVGLQLIVIVGSLSASAVAALSVSADTKYVSVVVSLMVAVAASCSLTFRLRERGDSLQRTANDIEREYRAAELQIGDYDTDSDEKHRLRQLVERIEALRAEQATIERSLEAPPDIQQSPTSGLGISG
ncbi:DUF4231 domain-containing protein [Mycolicibacterium sp. HK-90]|uniref:DUF4231 domain-containing protein n=1 Tax=Mycolicibacterium sp. HK-90 TaxID=3056937 RepID=UPI00265AFFF5|nr:DUF4231 domain-containing protein [Mycolicibacterium sp. HK-90]WKG06117.1 DUF4231 domain-containing protein [Mycolicibacterium sp. HK-90]